MRTRAKRGFTLVEILIVVVILGILAAIVIPQFSQASTESKLSSLQSNLQSLRAQIALYKIQHNDVAPTVTASADSAWTEMTMYTDIDGNTNATKTDPFWYGPYLQVVPDNPFTNDNTVTSGLSSGSTVTGWAYNATDGQIRAGYSGLDTVLGTTSKIYQDILIANYED